MGGKHRFGHWMAYAPRHITGRRGKSVLRLRSGGKRPWIVGPDHGGLPWWEELGRLFGWPLTDAKK